MHIIGTLFLSSIFPILYVGLVLAACLHDVVARTIPNGLVLALAFTGVVAGAINGNLPGSLGAASGVFIIAVFCWRRGWMGGGDVKLLGAVTLGLPAGSALTLVAAMAISGGLLALIYLATRSFVLARFAPRPTGLLARAVRVERWRMSRGGPLPYACAIAAGVLFVRLSGGLP